jgi:hypothetical protein
LGNTIDGNLFNKHNDQEKKTLVKQIFFTCMEFIQFKLLFSSHLVILTLKRIPSVFMYAMSIQNDVIGLVLHQNCESKQVTEQMSQHDTNGLANWLILKEASPKDEFVLISSWIKHVIYLYNNVVVAMTMSSTMTTMWHSHKVIINS